MTLTSLLAASAVVACAFASSVVACSSTTSTPADAGAEGAADARSDRASKDVTPGRDAREASLDGGKPYLTELTVSTSDAAPSELVPGFSRTVYDYYVRCAAGANALTVSIAASSGADSQLVQPTPVSASRPKQTLSVSVMENQAIVATATEGTAKTEYWVRCLPHDFPQLRWNPHSEAGAPPTGYYLVGNYLTEKAGGYAMVLDENGVPVWYYRNSATTGVCNVDALDGGTISFIPALGHVDQLHHLAPLGTTTLMTPALDEHELRQLSSGNYLVITHPLVNGVDLTGLSYTLPDGGTASLGPDSGVVDCKVEEVDPTGKLMWTWNAFTHLDPVKDIGYVGLVSGSDGGVALDAFHCNSIDVEPATGNLLVSACHMNTVFYVERASGKILWKMGGAPYTVEGAPYVPVSDPFFGQHDARFQPGFSSTCGGNGPISLFDDQFLQPGPARGVVYDVHVGPADGGPSGDCGASSDGGPAGASVAWQYKAEVSSQYMGSFRISPDDSRVIGWGTGGTPNLVFTEVDLGGHDLLDFYFDDGNVSYRAIKVPPSAFDREALRKAAGTP